MTRMRSDVHREWRDPARVRGRCPRSCADGTSPISTPSNSGRGRGANPAAKTPKESAPIDLTGYWVSIVSEDWRFRMLTPPKGDYPELPADPGRHQARQRVGSGEGRGGEGSLQGVRRAEHHARARPLPHHVGRRSHAQDRDRRRHADAPAAIRRAGRRPRRRRRARGRQSRSGSARRCAWTPGTCCRVTCSATACRSARTLTMVEYFDVIKEPGGEVWLIDDAVITDPAYLVRSVKRSTHLRKQADGAGWDPSAVHGKVNLVVCLSTNTTAARAITSSRRSCGRRIRRRACKACQSEDLERLLTAASMSTADQTRDVVKTERKRAAAAAQGRAERGIPARAEGTPARRLTYLRGLVADSPRPTAPRESAETGTALRDHRTAPSETCSSDRRRRRG